MRDKFIGYYPWTDEEFKELWDKAIFIFDTNTLLHIYRYQDSTCQMFLETLEAVQDNVWIPYQVGLEFHRNRRGCIKGQTTAYRILEDTLEGFSKSFDEVLKEYKLHKFIERGKLNEEFKEALAPISKTIESFKEKHPDYSESDTVLERVTKVFDNRIGEPMEAKELERVYKEGKDRYDNKIPPGYMDKKSKKKKGNAIYGDLVIWEEMIAKAKKEKRPVIFITSDEKEDWWLLDGRRTVGPRPDLLQEFKDRSDQLCYIYGPGVFISRAREFFKIGDTDEEAINEIKEVRSNAERKNLTFKTSDIIESIGKHSLQALGLESSSVKSESSLLRAIRVKGHGSKGSSRQGNLFGHTSKYISMLDLLQEKEELEASIADVFEEIQELKDQMTEIEDDPDMSDTRKGVLRSAKEIELLRIEDRLRVMSLEYEDLKELIQDDYYSLD